MKDATWVATVALAALTASGCGAPSVQGTSSPEPAFSQPAATPSTASRRPTPTPSASGLPISVPSHCGVLSVWVRHRLWVATPALGDHNPPRGWDENETPGRFVVVRRGHAVFRAEGGHTARFRLAEPGEADPSAGCE